MLCPVGVAGKGILPWRVKRATEEKKRWKLGGMAAGLAAVQERLQVRSWGEPRVCCGNARPNPIVLASGKLESGGIGDRAVL